MARSAITLFAILCLVVPTAAGGPPTKKPLGTWIKEGDATITFTFEADTLKCKLDLSGVVISVDADYGMSKDGVIFGRMTKVTKDGDAGPSVGDLFTLHFTVKDSTLTISKLGPTENNDARPLIEGEYRMVKGK
jgi:hypothetical protein